jgi:O-phospho-L-seryl-tRNASec:L-selenocysteinyl-tRNA synthase
MLVNELSSMDTNNFLVKSGVGEREGRVACDLVRKRHYNLSHGIGRSGDLAENQPKAAGSSLMSKITNDMLLDYVKMMGIRSAKKCMLFPVATGMAMMLSLLYLKSKRKDARYVLWLRIDQKSCFKAIVSANLIPIIIDTIKVDDELCTNLSEFEKQIENLGADKIVCIISTTSCFAPRACDNLDELAKISKKFNIPHVVNNAYGLQSTFLTHQIEQAQKAGNIDIVVQSTDKNLLVPVGGSIIFGFDEKIISDVSKSYPGRASSSQTLDVFMTLLNLGRDGYMKLVNERKEMFKYLKEKLEVLAASHDEKVLATKRNPISIAMTLKNFKNPTMIGSMLFTRSISGVRVVTTNEEKSIDGYKFIGWGSHINPDSDSVPYLTAAASIGITKSEIDNFIEKLEKVLLEKQNES